MIVGKKILIVDDEYYFRQGFQAMFDWQSRGYDRFCEAKNGREALEVAARECPDLIFLDINMPVLDGMGFLAQYSKWENTAPVVILTGFSEFAYAQQAIKYNVFDYLLKTVKWEDVTAVLDRLEQRDGAVTPPAREMDYQTRQRLRDKLMTDIVSGSLDLLQYDRSGYSDFLDFYPRDGQMRAVVAAIARDAAWQPSDLQLWRYAVSNILEELLGESFGCQIFNHTQETQVAAVLWDKDGSRCDDTVLLAAQCAKIAELISSQLKISVYIGLGGVCTQAQELAQAFVGACAAVNHALLSGGSRVGVQTETSAAAEPVFRTHEKQNLLVSLRLSDTDGMTAIVRPLFARLQQNSETAGRLEFVLDELCAVAAEAAARLEPQHREALLAPLRRESGVGLRELEADTVAVLTRLCKAIADAVPESMRAQATAEKVKRFIEQNYHRAELNESEIADHVFLNRTHLCAVFKKTTGMTVFSYINDLRMRRARDLFDSGCPVVQDVADRVGYADPNYFTKSFKKHTGFTPSQYLEIKRRESLSR